MVNIITNHQDLLFPGKGEGENFCFYFRQHWVRLMRPAGVLILRWVIIFGVGYISFRVFDVDTAFTRRSIAILLSVAFALTNLEFLASFYRYFLYIIIVSDKKIHRIKKTLVTVNDHQSIDLWMLQDIHKSQHGPIQNLLGFGTLVLDAQDSKLRVHFVPGINDKYVALTQLREQARSQMLPQPRSTPAIVRDL